LVGVIAIYNLRNNSKILLGSPKMKTGKQRQLPKQKKRLNQIDSGAYD
jgi:hypothetical protein